MSLYCQESSFLYTYCAWRLHSKPIFYHFNHILLPLFQLFPLLHVMSSQVWMKPPSFWNGVIHGTWVAAKTSSTMSSARSACPSGECAHGVMIMWTSRHATSALPSAAWLFATYKLTHSTALRFKRSMVFPTRAHIHLSSRQWTSPQIRLVGIAAVPCQPVKGPYWTCSCCQLSNTGKKGLKDCHRIFSVLKNKSSFSYMHVL